MRGAAALANNTTLTSLDMSDNIIDPAIKKVVIETNPVTRCNLKRKMNEPTDVPTLVSQSLFAVKKDPALLEQAQTQLPMDLLETVNKPKRAIKI
jgi:hypothetical protein